ncbi:hypothetical protein AHAS_Ahas15G0053300 [Arachis hypogaea]
MGVVGSMVTVCGAVCEDGVVQINLFTEALKVGAFLKVNHLNFTESNFLERVKEPQNDIIVESYNESTLNLNRGM